MKRLPFVLLLILMGLAALVGYFAFGLGSRASRRDSAPVQLAATADITLEGQPVQPFAALDPQLADLLLRADPYTYPNIGLFSADDVPPIGAYLPAERPESERYALRPDLAATIPPNLDASLFDFNGLPIESDAVGEAEPIAFSGTAECAPSGLPTSGVLTQRFHTYHSGIDIGVPLGTPVVATHSGVVTFAGWSAYGYGYLIILQSGTYITYYGHLTNFNVKQEDVIGAGTLLGWSGSTGNSTGPHLHYETRISDAPVDPLTFGTRALATC